MSDRQVSSEEINVLQEIGSYLQKADSDIEFLINIGNFSDSSDKWNNAYKIFGGFTFASNKDVKDAFRKMTLKQHPDKFASFEEDVKRAVELKF